MSGCRLLVVRTTWYENVEELLALVEGEVADQLLKMLQMFIPIVSWPIWSLAAPGI